MRFFFPDSQDQVDPQFDFITEEHLPFRIRQRDDRYAHELVRPAPYDGLLVSKPIVDGTATGAGKYTRAQRQRLYREGAAKFFRLQVARCRLQIMGDCGAFTYASAEVPPYRVGDVVAFYAGCGFDYGIAIDHIIFGYEPTLPPGDSRITEWVRRQELTLQLAAEFWHQCADPQVRFTPIGVAQGWSPSSYATAVTTLQHIGYRYIALGGLVPVATSQIEACLRAVSDVRDPATRLHLLGVSRCTPATADRYGVASFDSTAPFLQAFKDDHDNYHTRDRTYVALRVPQVDGNLRLRKRILAGRVDQTVALARERTVLRLLRAYDTEDTDVDTVLAALEAYTAVWNAGGPDRTEQYRQTLLDRPWRTCRCGICAQVGIDVVLFRGVQRNKRRGFHNLYVFRQRLRARRR